jgi:hypothetical protein
MNHKKNEKKIVEQLHVKLRTRSWKLKKRTRSWKQLSNIILIYFKIKNIFKEHAIWEWNRSRASQGDLASYFLLGFSSSIIGNVIPHKLYRNLGSIDGIILCSESIYDLGQSSKPNLFSIKIRPWGCDSTPLLFL